MIDTAKNNGTLDEVAESIGNALNTLINAIIKVTQFAYENKNAIIALAAGYGTFKIALSISNVVRDLSLALGVLTGATEAQTAAQMASNVAMAANPIGLVISGIAGLAAGLVFLIKNQKDYSNTLAECNKAMEDANKQSKQIVSDGNVEVSSIQKKAEIYEKLRDQNKKRACDSC